MIDAQQQSHTKPNFSVTKGWEHSSLKYKKKFFFCLSYFIPHVYWIKAHLWPIQPQAQVSHKRDPLNNNTDR